METYFVTKDIRTFYVQAASFPNGVGKAHKTLHDMLPSATGRNLMAISYPEGKQGIVYRAAVEEAFDGEAKKYGCDSFIIRKGKFASKTLVNWRDTNLVQNAFGELLSHPQLNKKGYCLEIYRDEHTMICLVPLDPATIDGSENEVLLSEIRDTFRSLDNTVAAFHPEQFNVIPWEGSWTPAQVAEHIIKFASGLPDQHTRRTERPYDQNVESLNQLFLNFSIKMQSPPFIVPGNSPHEISEVLAAFKNIRSMLEEKVKTTDLTETCLDFELPKTGTLTRYEWIRFIVVHVQRHIHQLQNILVQINNSKV